MPTDNLMPRLEGSIMPQAKFLQDIYGLAISRYQLATKYAQNKIILDAGCGAGYGANILAKSGAKKVYGIDIVAESIQYCQSKYLLKNLIFKRADLTNLDFPNNYFDLVSMFETIEHVKNYSKAIDEIYRVLKPGGLLILSTPNKAVYSPGTFKPFYPFHFYEFYLEDLKKMLADFEVQKILGQYVRGRKLLLYSRWNPKRLIRIIYANLPHTIKIWATRTYLRVFSWLYVKKIYQSAKIKLSDVYFSKNTAKTREFVVICQKPKSLNEKKS